MISWLLNLQYLVAGLAALFVAVLAFAKRKPSLVSLSALALVELGLVAQLVASVTLVVGGARAKTDTIEFFGYLSVALLIPLAAGFWALVERNRWSTMVLAVAAATAGIMLARMQQIWLG
ncbi:MAG: hypothetical protein KA500_00590 [Rhodoluna sp.]|nr:hypothetical protein [Rhodoluna sp.]